MKRWRRRLIWAGVFAIVMLGGLAGWFYYAVVLHPDFALRHAEAFAFRRITVSTLAEQRTYRFFYPTNRTPVSESGPLKDRFDRERQDSLSFGRFDAQIEPNLGPGGERITLVDVTPVNRTRNFHNFSLETPEFSGDLFLRLTNEETARSRQIHRVLTEDGRVHWVLTRGR